jgi:hypothetical protein
MSLPLTRASLRLARPLPATRGEAQKEKQKQKQMQMEIRLRTSPREAGRGRESPQGSPG